MTRSWVLIVAALTPTLSRAAREGAKPSAFGRDKKARRKAGFFSGNAEANYFSKPFNNFPISAGFRVM